MASTSKATKPIQTVLDSTKLATFTKFAGFVRHTLTNGSKTKSNKPIQGRLRNPQSNAFKDFARRENVKYLKALNSVSHGKHIFVYQNVRTKQVVYSLTRYLEKNNLLKQMVYHGKKTVPAEFRRDIWVPYYSVHFGDARLGLRAYQLLREFSMQRQLSPPAEMITVTEEFLATKRPRDPVGAEEYDKQHKKRIGQPMEKKERARVLMDQKATSVADIAAVLAIQEEEIAKGFLDRNPTRENISRTAKRRQHQARQREEAQAAENAVRIKALEANFSRRSGTPVKIGDGQDIYLDRPERVKVLWRDAHDAYYAESWPTSVDHGELELTRDNIMGSERSLVDSRGSASGPGSNPASDSASPAKPEEIVTEYEFKERTRKVE